MAERKIDILITAQDRTSAALAAVKAKLKNLTIGDSAGMNSQVAVYRQHLQQQQQMLKMDQQMRSSKSRVWEMNASAAQQQLREARRTYIEQAAIYRKDEKDSVAIALRKEQMRTQLAREYAARRIAIAKQESMMTSVGTAGGGGLTANARMSKFLGGSGGKMAAIVGLETAIPILAGLKASMMAINVVQDSWNIGLLKSTGQFQKAAEATLAWKEKLAGIPVIGQYINTLLVEMWHDQERLAESCKKYGESMERIAQINKANRETLRTAGTNKSQEELELEQVERESKDQEVEFAKGWQAADSKQQEMTAEAARDRKAFFGNLFGAYDDAHAAENESNIAANSKKEIDNNRKLAAEAKAAKIAAIKQKYADAKAQQEAAKMLRINDQLSQARIDAMDDQNGERRITQAQWDYVKALRDADTADQKKALKEILDIKIAGIKKAVDLEKQERAKADAERTLSLKDEYRDLQIAGMDDKGGLRRQAEINAKYDRRIRGANFQSEKDELEKMRTQELTNLNSQIEKESADQRKQASDMLTDLMIEGIADPVQKATAVLERDIASMRQRFAGADPGVVDAIEMKMRSNFAAQQEQEESAAQKTSTQYALEARESRFMAGATDVPPWIAEQRKTAEQNNKLVREGNQLLRDIKERLASGQVLPANIG